MPLSNVLPNIRAIMDEIFSTISFGIGRNNAEPADHEILEKNYPGWELEATKKLRQMAANQLGTVGSGNHYVDIFHDEKDRIWIGVHFGSRGLGHKTATWFLNADGAKDGMDVEPCVLPLNSDLGEQYIEAMTLAGTYAYAGRDWVCARVARILGGKIVEEVHNHHNFAWLEEHGGEQMWVVRKGATPAFPGQKGFVGGSMGEESVILEGVESPLNEHTLNSTVHGAGRVMGRMEAKGKFKNGVCVREGKVKQEMMNEWLERAKVVLRGGGLDEAPQCYKRLSALTNIGDRISRGEIQAAIEDGRGEMPSFHDLNSNDVDALINYLLTADLGGRGARGRAFTMLSFPPGPVVETGPAATRVVPSAPGGVTDYPQGISAPNFRLDMNDYGVEINARKPPYTSLTAYDLNKGTIKWQIGVGDDYRVVSAGGPHGTGAAEVLKSSALVTNDGLVHRQRRGPSDSFLRCRHGQGTSLD